MHANSRMADLEYDYFPSDHPTYLDQANVQKKLKETIDKVSIE